MIAARPITRFHLHPPARTVGPPVSWRSKWVAAICDTIMALKVALRLFVFHYGNNESKRICPKVERAVAELNRMTRGQIKSRSSVPNASMSCSISERI